MLYRLRDVACICKHTVYSTYKIYYCCASCALSSYCMLLLRTTCFPNQCRIRVNLIIKLTRNSVIFGKKPNNSFNLNASFSKILFELIWWYRVPKCVIIAATTCMSNSEHTKIKLKLILTPRTVSRTFVVWYVVCNYIMWCVYLVRCSL